MRCVESSFELFSAGTTRNVTVTPVPPQAGGFPQLSRCCFGGGALTLAVLLVGLSHLGRPHPRAAGTWAGAEQALELD